jgi:hypothetical protein
MVWLHVFWAEHHNNENMWWRVVHLMADRIREQDRKGPMTRYSQGSTPSDLFPAARPLLLKFPEPPKIIPPSGDQVFNM